MLRQIISVSLLGGLLASSLVPATAFFQYNSNISLQTRVPFVAPFATYVPPVNPVRPSVLVPGAPVLGTILDTWANVGNLMNWQVPAYGNYTRSYSSRTAFGSYFPTWTNRSASAQYYSLNNTGAQAVGNYTSGVSSSASPTANYTSVVQGQPQASASYVQPQQSKVAAQAAYTSPQGNSVQTTANYTSPTPSEKATATYVAPVAAKQATANYTKAPSALQPTATYLAPVAGKQATASYTKAPATVQPTATYVAPAVGKQATANYTTYQGAQVATANYTPPAESGGAAFGSLYGDGRTTAYGTTAEQSFLSRIRGRSATGYTSRAETLASGNLDDLYTVNPSIDPLSGPGRGLDYSAQYDRPFETSGGNLNAVPSTTTKTPGQAVSGAIQALGLHGPIVMNSRYTDDIRVLQAKGIMPASWTGRVATTELTRADIAEVLIRLRVWRETGNGNNAKMLDGAAGRLPIIGDLQNTDPSYGAFMQVAQRRMLYMPNLREENGVVVYADAEAKAPAGRAQTLQGVMTALYLRPDTTLSGSDYTDLAKESWYSPWALTAKTYGLSFGSRFEPAKTVTQAEYARMIAQLLEQFR